MIRSFRFLAVAAAAIGLAVTVTACDAQPRTPSARQVEQTAAQTNQANLNRSVPIPVLPMSQERENLVKRATRINVQNMSSCVTLFAENGAVVAFFPVQGKVSSLNSYLLSGDQIVDGVSGGYRQSLVVEQPDIDGAYGQNADGIFFFTADTDAYVEWKGSYFWSDQCLRPSGTPLLVETASTAPAPAAPAANAQ